MFSIVSVPYGGRKVPGAVITCGRCGKVASIAVNTFSRPSRSGSVSMEDVFIQKKARGLGWKVGNRISDLRCAGCFSAIRAAAAKSQGNKMEGAVQEVAKLVVVANEPGSREMAREDRRIIFEKLNEVYVNEKVGYGNGWNDQKVATDLGIPRAWVSQIRDDNFGPEGNEEIRTTVAQAKKLVDGINVTVAKLLTAKEDLTKQMGQLNLVEKRLAEIERALMR